MGIKTLLTTLAISTFTLTSFGQREMVAVGSTIYIDGMEMSITDAAMMAMILSPDVRSPEANAHFKQARRLGKVNKLMTVAGLWQMVTGTVYISSSPLHSGVLFGTVKFGIGSALVTSKLSRVDERQHILMGIEAYNKALAD